MKRIRDMVEKHGFEHGLLLLGCGKSVIRLHRPSASQSRRSTKGLEIFEHAITDAEIQQGLL